MTKKKLIGKWKSFLFVTNILAYFNRCCDVSVTHVYKVHKISESALKKL